jgi:transposase-like protein
MEVVNKHSRMPRKWSPAKLPRDPKTGRMLSSVPEDKKLQIIEEAKRRIIEDHSRLDEIAADHGISPRLLDYWMAGLGEEYRALRRAWLDRKLVESEENIAVSEDPFNLAKARELRKCAEWYAERRDPERYGQKQEITHKQDEPTDPQEIRKKIEELESKLGVKTITQEAA